MSKELSTELVSEFVKVVSNNNKKDAKKESTGYGTIVEMDGVKYVKMDGSDLLTPAASTADTVPGERVTVSVKNHQLLVTGNISSPAARTDDLKETASSIGEMGTNITRMEIAIADKVSTKEFDTEKARIDVLVADNVTIRQNLTANKADIDELTAETVKIEGRVTANEAKFETLISDKIDASVADLRYAKISDLEATDAKVNNLQSTYAEFASTTTNKLAANEASIAKLSTDKLDAQAAAITYATIAQLNTEKARIDDLEAEVADIDTLIFGSATGDTIQASFANAVIAQLSNAQIKSAMINSISADKITTGDIITNEVRVMSEDGKLLISDETIQISDSTRARVQIGKDGSGDYSINIWDADGNLMFSKGGITDKAIKTAIIRNDMVSDTANIAAHKLDINSLFEEINGSTKTIKSNRIYLDDASQTLDVVFESMSTDIDELQNGVSSQGTAIQVMQGQIASKVWQQDINTAVSDVNTTTENLSTQYEEMVQDLDGLSATVANHTSEISKKANSATVTEVSNKVASLETNLSGFKSEVGETYATKTELDDSNERIENAETAISNNAKAVELRATKTEVNTAKTEAINTANSNTTTLLKSYSTTEEMEAALRVESNSIKSTVSSTYATQTALATTNTNVTAAKKAADNAQADIDGLEIGGRNLLKGTRFDGEAKRYERLEGAGTEGGFRFEPTEQIESGVEYILSLSMRGNANIVFYEINSSGGNMAHSWIRREQLSETDFREFYLTFTVATTRVFDEAYICTQYGEDVTAVGDWFEIQSCTVKLERGNRKTDWSPAPEDMATSDDISAVQKSMESTDERLTASETVIQQLSDSIINLVTDGEGQSLMTQTEDGWTFSTKEIQDIVDATSEGLSDLVEEVGDVNSAVGILQQAVDDLGVLNDYVKIKTYEDEPCIELGETDSDFKLLITNTRILFMEGNDVPAYITNQALHIKKAVIEEELQQGEFLWKSRSNGNLGLVWKGV